MVEMSAKDRIKDRMAYEREKKLLQEQMSALRSALKTSQAENDAIRKDLEKEVGTAGGSVLVDSVYWPREGRYLVRGFCLTSDP